MSYSFKELDLKESYDSSTDDLINDFYISVLENSKSYDRIAGFFSSSSLAIAARGIAGLIINEGKMRILTSPKLSPEDIEAITSSKNDYESYLERNLLAEISNIENEFEQNYCKALGWMLAKGLLEIKIVYSIDDNNRIQNMNLFHQKVGLLKDMDGNNISFSGSINESASGWLNNIEEFKVFREWLPGQKVYFDSDNKRFNELWEGSRNNIKVVDIPQAVKDHLIEFSKDFRIEKLAISQYFKMRKEDIVEKKLSLFDYQKEAVKMWINNGYRLLFEMATGTGKTRTALACVNEAMKKEEKMIVIIACPQNTLAKQWKDNEVEPAGFVFDSMLIADQTNPKWRDHLLILLNQISVGYYNNAVIYTTHDTASSNDFISIIIENSMNVVEYCFIGDEVHGLGALKTKKALIERYKYRIGLSATPKRWFDDYGTKIISDYFGNMSFEFTISDALTTINPLTNKPFLVNYYYYPIFVYLLDNEIEEYIKLTKKISRLSKYKKYSDDYEKCYESLVFNRAKIQKNAKTKYEALADLLVKIGHIENTIIFVSDVQIDSVNKQLKDRYIVAHRFTQNEGVRPEKKYGGLSERQYLINHFKNNNYQALVAINCLNEGIDIPSADTAILMSNSTNPREYIQRIGRVIRQSKNKKNAVIYDFIVEPDIDKYQSQEMRTFEKQIFEKELIRAYDMAKNAINNAEVRVLIDAKLWGLKDYGN